MNGYVGAEVRPAGGVHFCVWAPRRRRVEVVLEGNSGPRASELTLEADGYFSGAIATATAGAL
ncbi:MAG TPA: hypothetical protein VKD71_13915, partial [Gemmataceae bacterium]|nr:hypothetical protein [Gemmataceae bacterium]